MNKRYFILIPLFCIWLIASLVIAYQGQFYSEYLIEFLKKQPQNYPYPIFQVLTLSFIYGIWLLSYAFLFCSNWGVKHPYITYTLCSILPILLSSYGFFIAFVSSLHVIAFILISIATTLLHFLLLPVLIPVYRKYVYPNKVHLHLN
ncbi:hypothetical protein EXE10_04760 [Acinetobacter sp. WCHAc060033]|uniref:hypothetical protein n=1 Tax=Acinetobacter sp. WCHAc060033 TaxID=2518624 RepID=UPI001022D683|nr:hypothetical protein [Acinetobacter sp. WCHAc060033]RZG87198.1 hypothetical protein EXE10_04760 [Acinetobacter sp. WCHAc060033]